MGIFDRLTAKFPRDPPPPPACSPVPYSQLSLPLLLALLSSLHPQPTLQCRFLLLMITAKPKPASEGPTPRLRITEPGPRQSEKAQRDLPTLTLFSLSALPPTPPPCLLFTSPGCLFSDTTTQIISDRQQCVESSPQLLLDNVSVWKGGTV